MPEVIFSGHFTVESLQVLVGEVERLNVVEVLDICVKRNLFGSSIFSRSKLTTPLDVG